MTSTLDEGLLSCAAESYLSGDAEAPRRSAAPFSPIILLVAARTSGVLPSLLDPSAFRGDVRLTGLYRSIKLTLDAYRGDVRRDRGDAEHLAAIRLLEAYRLARQALHERGGFLDLDLDYTLDEQALDEELRLLVGVLALTLWHVGNAEAREYVRGIVADRLAGGDGYRFVETAIGMQEDTDGLSWRPGQGSLGSLRLARERGQALLWAAVRGPERSKRPEPVAVEEPARAPEAKVARVVVDTRPSLLVLASVEHLPGAAKSGESRPSGLTGATVRSEWAPFAGRAWPLLPVPDLAAAREVLVGEFPYAKAVIDAVLRDLAGRPHVYVRPLLLVGRPGCGKTRLARRLAEVLGLGFQICSLSGSSDSALIGTSRQWSTYRASTPLQLLKRLSMACAAIIADEIDKTATSKHNGSALDGLLPFLTTDACRIVDPALECPVDLSAVSWIATANDLDGLRRAAPALLDRFKVYTVPDPRREHLPALLRGVMAELRVERGLDEHWMPDLAPDEAELVEAHWRGGSVRGVRRLVEAVLAGRESLATRM